jgi:phosphopantothenoylcysteine decarboxylase / phosphopantothenate---cysteine ligase
MSNTPRILLIVSGGIAAYKALELVRLLKREGIKVRAVMTDSAREFVTPLSLGVITEDQVYGAMFDLKEEREIGHIQLSRQADLIVIAPATANILAKMAAGIADDLATTILLATDKPVLAVPAMNVRMWQHPATMRNLAQLRADGISIMPPAEGNMACGEYGPGRLPEPPEIVTAIQAMLNQTKHGPLNGKHVIVTAGPTHEPIDPVRYIANRSSGKQGFALAAALTNLGARVTLIAGPVSLPTPPGLTRINVETAQAMHQTVEAALPADAAVMVAAVGDWRTQPTAQKIKKRGNDTPKLELIENPDILASLARHKARPRLLIGFAAETEQILTHASAKLADKGCDWIVANDVSDDVMGGAHNQVQLITENGVEPWPKLHKQAVADRLAQRIADALN